jgi:membrane protease YdiL (CAAX protease family)
LAAKEFEELETGRNGKLGYYIPPMAAPLRNYLKETRRPIYSAALVLPFFLIYHLGTLFLRTTWINGADALIIRILSLLSVHTVFASALVLLLSFVIWQLRTRASWRLNPWILIGLFAESLLFALLLLAAVGWFSTHMGKPGGEAGVGPLGRLVLYCGAGIYEELVFRGFLMGVLLVVFRRLLKTRPLLAASSAVVLGAVIFAMFHYLGPAAESFTFAGFLQRTVGGVYFSLLFVARGFGVCAATHALYDILLGLGAA